MAASASFLPSAIILAISLLLKSVILTLIFSLGPLALPVSGAGTGAVGGLLVVILAGLLARLMPALRSLVHSRYGRGRSRERYWTISISLTRASNRGSDLSGANPE